MPAISLTLCYSLSAFAAGSCAVSSSAFLPKVYFYMSRLDAQISNSSLPQRLKPDVKDIVKQRWEYAHIDIHSAGFCLDPEFWHLNLNQEVRFVTLSCALQWVFMLGVLQVSKTVLSSLLLLQN